tara:strand:+ start:679 stop:963 length:285 start_codon:yes stop_codon:yes gene_type:complete
MLRSEKIKRTLEIQEEIKKMEEANNLNNKIIDGLLECNKLDHHKNLNKNQILGILISKYLEWEGDSIMEVASSAFEDSNYHDFNSKILNLWQKQ